NSLAVTSPVTSIVLSGDIVSEIPPNLLATDDPLLLPRPPRPAEDRGNTLLVRLILVLYEDTEAVAQKLRKTDRLVPCNEFHDALSPNIVVGKLGLHLGGCGDQRRLM